MKKILFTTWSVSFGYGTERSLADVVNQLPPEQFQIDILPIFKKDGKEAYRDDIRILDALVDYTLPGYDGKRAYEEYEKILSAPVLFQKRIKDSYDCVIACNHNAPSYLASYLNGGAKLGWIRGDMRELDYRCYEPGSPEFESTLREFKMQKKVFEGFDTIVVISDSVREVLASLFGITENVRVIANSADLQRITELSVAPVTLPQKKLFTSLGRLDDNKNQMMLLKAVALLKQKRDDFEVYLLGDGENQRKIETFLQENDLSDIVTLKGFVDNPYPFIKHSVATVLTSRSEGFGLVLLESILLNTPFISTRVGVAKELLDRYACGCLIHDENELADKMLDYLNRPDEERDILVQDDEYLLSTEVRKTKEIISETVEKYLERLETRHLPYRVETIFYDELADYEVKRDEMYILRVKKDNVPYEYLINRKSGCDKLVVFNNAVVSKGDVKHPVFQRHSWSDGLKTSSVYCMDPTLYVSSFLKLGWGVGKNDVHFLEFSSRILETLIKKMEIRTQDTVIYGSSCGGFISILMGIFVKGATVVADNAQFDLTGWSYKEVLAGVLTFCFDDLGDALKYMDRFNVVNAFEKNGYIPPLYICVNLLSEADNSSQLIPFLKRMEQIQGIQEEHKLEVHTHYCGKPEHASMSKGETIDFLYRVLAVE